MIRKIVLFLFVFLYLQLFAQKKETAFLFPEIGVVYSGYFNLVRIQYHGNSKKIDLKCFECNIVRQLERNSSDWLIQVDSSRTICLELKTRSGKILKEQEIKVYDVPSPEMYLDSLNSQNSLKKCPDSLRLKLEKSIPLHIAYGILSWTIWVDGTEFTGIGKMISNSVKEQMIQNGSGILKIKITYSTPFGHKILKDFFEYELNTDGY